MDPGQLEPAARRRDEQVPALGERLARQLDELVVGGGEADRRRLAPLHRLAERLGECTAEPERLADGAHLRA